MALSTEHAPEYDAKITKGGVTLGFKLSDGQGMHDPFSISQDQQSRSAIKIASGDTKHSDYEPPYVTEETRDWSVGRGMNDGDEEEGRFYDSKSAWTPQKGRIMLGPKWGFGLGMDNTNSRYFQTNMFDEINGAAGYGSSNQLSQTDTYRRFAVRVQADASYTVSHIEMIAKWHGADATECALALYADSAGTVGAVMSGGTITRPYEQDNFYVFRCALTTPQAVTSGSYYWIVFISSQYLTGEYFEVLTQAANHAGSEKIGYYNGSTWTYNPAGKYPPYYRMMEAGKNYRPIFTSYFGVPIVFVNYKSSFNLFNAYMNGFICWASYTTSTSTYVRVYIKVDTIPGLFTGCQLTVVSGKGSELQHRSYEIETNGGNYFQFDIDKYPNIGSEISGESMLAVTGSDYWYQIYDTDQPGFVTDAVTVGKIIHIARGDYGYMAYLYYPNTNWQGSGYWNGVFGTHVEYALDSTNTPRIWIARTDSIEKSSYPVPQLASATRILYGLDVSAGELATNPYFGSDMTGWSDVSTPDETEAVAAYSGTGSKAARIIANDDAQGITQSITTTVGDEYHVHATLLLPLSFTVADPDMELDNGSWTDEGTPTTNARDTAHVNSGTYSRHVVADGDAEGIKQTVSGLTVGKMYSMTAYVYIDAASANGIALNIDGTDLDTLATTGAFVKIWASFVAAATTATIKFVSDGGAAEFWVDTIKSASTNGAKVMFAGTEVGSIDAGNEGAWSFIEKIIKATDVTHTLQALSDGGEAMFYCDSFSVRELPTYIGARNDEHITNLIVYGEPERLWVLTNKGIYQEDGGALTRVPIYEMANAADTRNGVAATVYDVYLMYSFMNGGIERYYKSNLDDIGPDRDEGLLNKGTGNTTYVKSGEVSALASYPTGVFAAIDAAKTDPDYGYPSILFFNSTGWHEIWSGDTPGDRIEGLHIQPIDGDTIDKLWFVSGGDMMYIPIDKNPETNTNYRYTYESVIESPWITRGKHDVIKYLDEISLVTRVNSSLTLDVDAYYKLDDDTDWTLIGNFSTMPRDSIAVGSHDVEGRKIKIKLNIRTDHSNLTPRIEAVLLDMIEAVPVKDSWSFQFLLDDNSATLLGKPENSRVETVVTAINTMRSTPAPVYLETRHSAYDQKWASILTFSTRPIANDAQGQKEQMIGTLTLIEA